MENNTKDYLKVAVLAAKQAELMFIKHFGHAGRVENKNGNPRDFVTEIDRRIESQIRKLIGKHFPEHKIIGEEFNKDEVNKDECVWIIDPIDGTTNYIHGIPIACISIGLWKNNQPMVAVVYNPCLGQLLTATKNGGAFVNGKKIAVSKQVNLSMAFGGFGWGRDVQKAAEEFPKMVNKLSKIRTLGSTTWEICLTAMGKFDFLVQYRTKVWDFAAAILILQEAGGKVTDIEGQVITIKSHSLLASNKKLHNLLLKKVV